MKATMKVVYFVALLFVATDCCSAFVVHRQSVSSCLVRPMAAVELEPEPEGGKELTAATSIDGCRMKEMGEASEVKSEDGPAYKFWMSARAEGDLTKEIRTQILKDASKKANFPGFRKVCWSMN